MMAVDHLRAAEERTSGQSMPYLTDLSDAALSTLSGAVVVGRDAQGARERSMSGQSL
jgi:hypothetical protein